MEVSERPTFESTCQICKRIKTHKLRRRNINENEFFLNPFTTHSNTHNSALRVLQNVAAEAENNVLRVPQNVAAEAENNALRVPQNVAAEAEDLVIEISSSDEDVNDDPIFNYVVKADGDEKLSNLKLEYLDHYKDIAIKIVYRLLIL